MALKHCSVHASFATLMFCTSSTRCMWTLVGCLCMALQIKWLSQGASRDTSNRVNQSETVICSVTLRSVQPCSSPCGTQHLELMGIWFVQGSSSLLGPQGEGPAYQDHWPPWCTYGDACQAGWSQVGGVAHLDDFVTYQAA